MTEENSLEWRRCRVMSRRGRGFPRMARMAPGAVLPQRSRWGSADPTPAHGAALGNSFPPGWPWSQTPVRRCGSVPRSGRSRRSTEDGPEARDSACHPDAIVRPSHMTVDGFTILALGLLPS